MCFYKTLSFTCLIISNIAFAANKGTECEIMYASHPHPKAIIAVGSERLKQVSTLSYEETAEFSKTFIPLTNDIISSLVGSSNKSIKVKEQELILGGYEGETVTSVVIKTVVFNDKGQNTLLKLAAHIGYVYAQDSTLVICSDKPSSVDDNWTPLRSIEIKDEGKEDFFKEKNVPIFFGMMIGAHNSPDNLGYTFYKNSKIFSTLASSTHGKEELDVLSGLANWVKDISDGDISLNISSKDTWVFFPHNDWESNPLGKSYKKYININAIKGLDIKRQQFLNRVDQFFIKK